MSPALTGTGTVIGVLGAPWRATVDGGGALTVHGGPTRTAFSWWVAAEDRWHDPQREPTVRQRRVEGTPVVETRLRVPSGDVVHRVYASAAAGGLTVIEIDNESAAAVAVVFSQAPSFAPRPPTDVPVAARSAEGVEIPTGAVSYPIAHRSSLRIAVAHRGSGAPSGPRPLPAGVPDAAAVVRGWLRQTEQAARLLLPDVNLANIDVAEASVAARVTAARCDVLLGANSGADDPVASLIALGETVRMGADPDPLVPTAVTAAERIASDARRCGLDWDAGVALAAAEAVLIAAEDRRAAGDLAAIRSRLGGDGAPIPPMAPVGVRLIPWVEQRIAQPISLQRCVLLPEGFPTGWLGVNWEAHHLPAGPQSRVSVAVRWHGERPAVLWEITGAPTALSGGRAAPQWSSDEPRGEALWPQP